MNKNNLYRIGMLVVFLLVIFHVLGFNLLKVNSLETIYTNGILTDITFKNFLDNIMFYFFTLLIFSFMCKNELKERIIHKSKDTYVIAIMLLFLLFMLLFPLQNTVQSLLLLLLSVFIFASFFGYDFIKQNYGSLILSYTLSLVTFFLASVGSLIWFYMANNIAFVSENLLVLMGFEGVVNQPGLAPIVGTQDFYVRITALCSGTDSLILFAVMYFIFFAFDYDIMNKTRAFWYFVIGILGIIIINTIRITALIYIGTFDPEFALGAFHTNAGWFLFLIYFLIYWNLVYKRLVDKNKVKKNN